LRPVADLVGRLGATDAAPAVRLAAIRALGASRRREVLPLLAQALQRPAADEQLASTEALGQIHARETVPLLVGLFDRTRLMRKERGALQQAAARALGGTKNPAAIPFLVEALRDSFWWYERERAANDLFNAIENMGSPVVDPLIEALTDKEGAVRKFSAVILGNLGDPRAIDELGMALYDLHHDVSAAAAEALTKFGAAAVSLLIEALKHPEPAIRVNAISALGKIQDARVAAVLIEMLRDPERGVKKQALQSLGQLRDIRRLPALEEIASNRADREMSALAKQILETVRES